MKKIKMKRVYANASNNDGYRILVDRIWPRGVRKEDLPYNWWAKEMTPTTKIRKEFNHEKAKFSQFKEDYVKELNNNDMKEDFLSIVKEEVSAHNVTLLYAAKDPEINHVVILKNWIENQLDMI